MIASFSLAAFAIGCRGGNDPDIVQIAQSKPELSILVEAVGTAGATGLADTLKGRGPYTVFTPTNAAFASLLTELGMTKEQLLADKELLTTVLTHHVLAGNVRHADIPLGEAVATLQGAIFKVDPWAQR